MERTISQSLSKDWLTMRAPVSLTTRMTALIIGYYHGASGADGYFLHQLGVGKQVKRKSRVVRLHFRL
ncbi:hypothetical protein OSM86_23010, partial [Escherichia coli]|nr:hypothetical protein [Escherichia coli]